MNDYNTKLTTATTENRKEGTDSYPTAGTGKENKANTPQDTEPQACLTQQQQPHECRSATTIMNISSYVMIACFYICIMLCIVLLYGVITEPHCGGTLSREEAASISEWAGLSSVFLLIGYAVCKCLYVTTKGAERLLARSKKNKNGIPVDSIPSIRKRAHLMGPRTNAHLHGIKK